MRLVEIAKNIYVVATNVFEMDIIYISWVPGDPSAGGIVSVLARFPSTAAGGRGVQNKRFTVTRVSIRTFTSASGVECGTHMSSRFL
jgi:hypothetical protein